MRFAILLLLAGSVCGAIYDVGFMYLEPMYIAAADVAVADVNSKIMTGGDTLRISFYLPDMCSSQHGRDVALPFLLDQQKSASPPVAIIGPECTLTGLQLVNNVTIPMITWAATNPQLRHQQNPYFFRTSQMDLGFGYIKQFADLHDWSRVAIFSVVDDLSSVTRSFLQNIFGEKAVFVSEVEMTANRRDYEREIRQALALHLRVFFYIHWEAAHQYEFMMALHSENAYGDGFVLVFTDDTEVASNFTNPLLLVTRNATEFRFKSQVLENAIGFGDRYPDLPQWLTDKIAAAGSPSDFYSGYIYDAVTAAAIGIERCKSVGEDPRKSLRSQLELVVFQGVTSDQILAISENLPTRSIRNYISSFPKTIGFVTEQSLISLSKPIVWPGGRTVAPSARRISLLVIATNDEMLRTAKIAVADVNAAQLLPDGDVMELSDVKYQPCVWDESMVAALVAADVVVSCNCSPTMLKILTDVTTTPIIDVCATSVALSKSSNFHNFIRLCVSDDVNYVAPVTFLNSLGVQRVALLYQSQYEYAAIELRSLLTQGGIVIPVYTSQNDTARSAKIADAKINFVLVLAYGDATWALDGGGTVIISPFGFLPTPPAARLVTTDELVGPRVADLRRKLGVDPLITSLYTYDAVTMLALAMSNFTSDLDPTGRKNLTLAGMRSLTYSGMLHGAISFTPGTNNRGQPVYLGATVRPGGGVTRDNTSVVAIDGGNIAQMSKEEASRLKVSSLLAGWPVGCENGTFPLNPDAFWGMRCSPCAPGTWRNLSGRAICEGCPSSAYCPLAAGAPLFFAAEGTWRVEKDSVTPRATNRIADEYELRLFSLVTSTILPLAFALLAVALAVAWRVLGERVVAALRRADQVSRYHFVKISEPLFRRKTFIGGISTALLAFFAITIFIIFFGLGTIDRAALTLSLRYDRDGFVTASDRIDLTIDSVLQTENTPLQCTQTCVRLREIFNVIGTCGLVAETQGCRVTVSFGAATVPVGGQEFELEFNGRAYAVLWRATTDFRQNAGASYYAQGNVTGAEGELLFGENILKLMLIPSIYEDSLNQQNSYGYTVSEITTILGRTVNASSYFTGAAGTSTKIRVVLELLKQTSVSTVIVKTTYATIFAQILSVYSTVFTLGRILMQLIEKYLHRRKRGGCRRKEGSGGPETVPEDYPPLPPELDVASACYC